MGPRPSMRQAFYDTLVARGLANENTAENIFDGKSKLGAILDLMDRRLVELESLVYDTRARMAREVGEGAGTRSSLPPYVTP